ncbi:PAS domain-containing protein [Telmatobacter sp. DSM 110680]|uniref:histidine kinase n=1 Tax=Telmatobacter sp. DSM 110680 TaxID=3036704 RepID=A0AAU7DH18_9BACT
MPFSIPSSERIARLPWLIRILLGCCMASGAVALTSVIAPLRAFPLLLTFPTVILAAWFLGMWGAAGCAFMDVALVNTFLTRSQFQFSTGNVSQEVRLAIFVLITMLLGWSIRRLAQQKAELANHALKRQLESAEANRQIAEERAIASEQLRYRDDVLELALKASGMGLWAWDFEKEVVHRSDEVYRMVGCEPGAFGAEPEAWLQFVVPEDVPMLDEAFAKARNEGADYHAQYRVRWPDGSLHWLESEGKCQRNAEGNVARIYGVMADITHRKQSEEAMLRAEKLAVAGRLAASVAHEINNPLEAIANMLYLITISDSAEQARAQAANALDELMRISLVAQSTLKFHRESGAPRMALLSEVLDSVLTMFRGRIQTTNIAVDIKAKQELPITCMLSETQQVFANLIANAIESMPSGGRLIVRIQPSRDWRNRAVSGMRVTICDTGGGIDRVTQSRIFEPFFTTKTDTGTGLGLWVVAQLIERHDGAVSVWSSQRPEASGTAFSIFLPFGEELFGEGSIDRGKGVASIRPLSHPMEIFSSGSLH